MNGMIVYTFFSMTSDAFLFHDNNLLLHWLNLENIPAGNFWVCLFDDEIEIIYNDVKLYNTTFTKRIIINNLNHLRRNNDNILAVPGNEYRNFMFEKAFKL